MEKIINEFRVIETDDGFRIEIKGDKEKIKAFMGSLGGHERRRRHHGRRWGFALGPFGFGPMMWMKAAACCGTWDFAGEEAEEASEA